MIRASQRHPIFLLLLAVILMAGISCKKASPPAPLPPVDVKPQKEAPAAPKAAGDEEQTKVFKYDPGEYRNPFGSLLRVKKVTEDGIPEELLTPLQRIPVADMVLQSVIISSRKSVAHVITPDGKAHIVTVGTLMGRHKGKVVKINSDEIIVEEQFEDYLGRAFKQETVLRLREQEGESM